MKKVLLSSIFAVALIATAGYGVNKSMKSDANLSDLALANVEALADGESGEGQRVTCYNSFEGYQGFPMEDKTWCYDCKDRPASNWSDKSECSK
jgi:hypothetical protein